MKGSSCVRKVVRVRHGSHLNLASTPASSVLSTALLWLSHQQLLCWLWTCVSERDTSDSWLSCSCGFLPALQLPAGATWLDMPDSQSQPELWGLDYCGASVSHFHLLVGGGRDIQWFSNIYLKMILLQNSGRILHMLGLGELCTVSNWVTAAGCLMEATQWAWPWTLSSLRPAL